MRNYLQKYHIECQFKTTIECQSLKRFQELEFFSQCCWLQRATSGKRTDFSHVNTPINSEGHSFYEHIKRLAAHAYYLSLKFVDCSVNTGPSFAKKIPFQNAFNHDGM